LRRAIDFDGPLCYTPHRLDDGVAAYRAACERGDEGVIAKLSESTYEGRRSTNWLKFNCVRDQEFVVGGYTAPKGSRVEFGALLLGCHEGRDLVYAGKVGTGFDQAALRNLHERLSTIKQDASPFTRGLVSETGAHWVHPELVAQIGFTEWTRDGKLRHPPYRGLRIDKDSGERREGDPLTRQHVETTNPDPLSLPAGEITRRDLLDIYCEVADIMLP
jgi:ATP-dependent DNA ligase